MRIDASPETVFAFFTDPARMVQWMGGEAMLDPRPGGIFRVAFEPPGPVVDYMRAAFGSGAPVPRSGAHVVRGEFVEVEPYRRIAFTWGFERKLFAVPPQSSAVEVTFTEQSGGTIVRLAHRRLPPSAAEFHRAGWEHYLPRLMMVAAGRDPGMDPWQATR